jgi:hypothetical protein
MLIFFNGWLQVSSSTMVAPLSLPVNAFQGFRFAFEITFDVRIRNSALVSNSRAQTLQSKVLRESADNADHELWILEKPR